MKFVNKRAQQRVPLLVVWGIGASILPLALIFCAHNSCSLFGLLFGLQWFVTILITMGFILWLIHKGNNNGNDSQTI